MTRLITFINVLVASWVTLSGSSIMFVLAWKCMHVPACDISTVLNSTTIGYDYVTLVFGLWIFDVWWEKCGKVHREHGGD